MLAKIVKIDGNKVVIKNGSGKFTDVDASELQFNYELGDTIEIERNGDEFYYLPHKTNKKEELDEFWEDDEPKPLFEKAIKAKTNSSQYKGIGGWLGFYIFSTIVGVCIGFYRIFADNISSSECSLMNKYYNNMCKDLTPLLTFENIMLGFLIVVRIIGLIFIYRRKKSGAKFNATTLFLTAVWNILDLIFAASLFSSSKYGMPSTIVSASINSMLPSLIGSTVASCIWGAYFLKSQRVKNTLTEE